MNSKTDNAVKQDDERKHVADPGTSTTPIERAVPVENQTAKITTVFAAALVFASLVYGYATLKGDVSTVQRDVSDIKTRLSQFDRLATIQSDINDLRKHGSDALQEVTKEVSRLQEELKLHIATTTTTKDR